MPEALKKKVLRPAKRLAVLTMRRALLAYMRSARPSGSDADRRVVILLMSAWGMGGTIRAAHNLAGHLAAHGYDVELASIFRLRAEPFFSGGFPPGVKVTALDDHREEATPRPLRPVRKLLRRFNSVMAHPKDAQIEWWNMWVDIKLARLLRRRAGAILVTTRPSLNLISSQYASPAYIKVGLEQINLGTWKKTLRKAMTRHYPNLDVLVALTAGDVEAYDRLLDGRLRLDRIPNTVHAMGGPEPDLATKTLIAAGRYTSQKGFDLLIPAFAKIAADFPDWTLRICGKGQQKAELKQLVKDLGVGKQVELPGPANDMGAAFAEASIFVLSSRYEGFPLILIEAMSKGLAVVSFDCPTGPADIIDDHENGILVPHKDVDALAEGMRQLMADEDLRRKVAANAAVKAREYEIENIGPKWEELFETLYAARNGRG
jgi:glycosyltransferase involved in cell wall biosynthesis